MKRIIEHIPVLLEKVLNYLPTEPAQGLYIDATFGRGGHAKAILARLDHASRLIAFDRDVEAVDYARQTIQDSRFQIVHAPFSAIQSWLTQQGLMGQVQGILFDLGISSPQLDNPHRGFSFLQDGLLDMRMDTTQGQRALDWLAVVDEKTLADSLWQYGEERFSRRIASAIMRARQATTITSTFQLAQIIKHAMPAGISRCHKHPATRSFQAIRIVINQELTELEQGLAQGLAALAVGGRLAVISFHSLEDRIVKQFIRRYEKAPPTKRSIPERGIPFVATLQSLSKPIKPSLSAVARNVRARSAILRVAEKIV